MAASGMHGLFDLWLGTDPAQRLRLRQTSLAMALMVISVIALHYAVHVGGDDRGVLLWAWTACSLAGMAAFYGAIRSGWSLRFRDPSLTSQQIAFALIAAALGYAQAGPLRGAVFPVLTLILMFGMFQLRARSAYALSLLALLLFGLTMAYMAGRRPAVYPPAVEIGHFLMLACMLPAVAMLTARLSRIRRRLSEQREELARALAQLQAIATRDELTGLPNRRQMQALMDQELLRSLRHHHDFCIALVDLDHFKQINDTFSHAVGDDVLRAVADLLRGVPGHAGRQGGEEFILILRTGLGEAVRVCESLRRAVEAYAWANVAPGLSVTTSVGVTEVGPGDDAGTAVGRADALLYVAKNAGRNRVEPG